MGLTALAVKNAKGNGKRQRLGDGDNLWLFIDKNGNKTWVFRYLSPITGKEREMGLGSERDLSLSEARDKRDEARKLLRDGVDPLEARRQKREAARVDASKGITFRDYAEKFIAGREAGWKNPIHRQQWRNSLRDHAYPHIGNLAVADVDTDAVLKVLRPIWNKIPETARRVRGRIETILSAATVEKLRTGQNPAAWKGHLEHLGLARRKKSDVEHHPALDYRLMPRFWKSLAGDTSDAAGLLKFIILTVPRYNEAAEWNASEVKGDVWTIPGIRMKGDKPHPVPLTKAALDCLPVRRVSDVALANCIARHTDQPATTHGMRSSFRDWAGDCTEFPREIAEAALAHQVGDDAERAYRRGTALERRRALMNAWSSYLHGETP
jgi:integrase